MEREPEERWTEGVLGLSLCAWFGEKDKPPPTMYDMLGVVAMGEKKGFTTGSVAVV